MMRRRLTQLLSSTWGRLSTACVVLAVLLWSWSAVLTLGSLGQDHETADRLASAALVLTVLELPLLGLHEAHLRHLRGEADALDVRQVLDHIRSLRTSANGWIAMVLVALGVAAWAYVWVVVRWLGLDVPGIPDAGSGGLVMSAGTLSCAAAGLFAVTHFKERR